MLPVTNAEFEDARRSREAVRLRAHELQLRAQALGQRAADARSALAEAVETAARLRVEAQAALGLRSSAAVPGRQCSSLGAVSQFLALTGLGEEDLCEVTDGLIAALREAEAIEDEAAQILVRRALWTIGHHLATRLGPKTAGMVLN